MSRGNGWCIGLCESVALIFWGFLIVLDSVRGVQACEYRHKNRKSLTMKVLDREPILFSELRADAEVDAATVAGICEELRRSIEQHTIRLC